MRKEYAPLISTEKFYYPDSDFEDKNFIWVESGELSLIAMYCPSCGCIHVHPRDEWYHIYDEYTQNNYTCPECGYRALINKRPFSKRVYPHMATIFKNADGAKSISFCIGVDNFFFPVKKMKETGFLEPIPTPIHKTRYYNVRLIFSANGQTYIREMVTMKGRCLPNMPKSHPRQTRTITYEPLAGNYRFDCATEYLFRALIKNGIIAENENVLNRFRNLSPAYIKEAEQLVEVKRILESATSEKFYRERKIIKRLLSRIPMNADDEFFVKKLGYLVKDAPKSKAFRRLFFKRPVNTWLAWDIFNLLEMKDINSFYKFASNDNYKTYNLFMTPYNVNFAKLMIKICGEQSIANVLASQNKLILFKDSADYYTQLRHHNIDDKLTNSIRKTHDNLMAFKSEISRQFEQKRNIDSALYYAERVNKAASEGLSSDYYEELKQHFFACAEKIWNNEISYTAKEKELETTLDGIEFYLPPDTDHLLECGERLHNCVGHNYRINALHKESIIVLMRQKERLVGCIEICDGKIRQALGPCNAELKGVPYTAFTSWKQINGLNMYNANYARVQNSLRYRYDSSKFNLVLEKVKALRDDFNKRYPQISNQRYSCPF